MTPREADSTLSRLQREHWAQDQSRRRKPHHPVVHALFEPRAEFIASLVPAPAAASVLDVGCGNGFMTLPLEARWGRVVGLDSSAAMLAVNPCAQKLRASALDLPFGDREFDLVVTSHLLHHLDRPERERVVREMARVARVAVVIYEPNRNNPLMFAFGLLQPEERLSLQFSPGHLRRLLRQAGLSACTVRSEGMIVPNKAPRAWAPLGRWLNRTPLRLLGFYLRGVGWCHDPNATGGEPSAGS